jgi:hypothetical protein
LENLETVELQVIDRLRAIALGRYVAWHEAQALIAKVDTSADVEDAHASAGAGAGGLPAADIALDAAGASPGAGASSALAVRYSEVLTQSSCAAFRTAFLRIIAREGGLAVLDAVVEARAKWLPWLTASAETVSVVVEVGLDPFAAPMANNRFDHSEYVSCCSALASCVAAGAYPERTMQELQYLKQTQLLKVLFTAGYIELTSKLSNGAGADALGADRALSSPPERLIASVRRHFSHTAALPFALGLCENFATLPPADATPAGTSLFVADCTAPLPQQVTALLKLQVLTHAVVLAESHERSWFAAVLKEPGSQQQSLMLTMPDDELAMVMRASERGSKEQYETLNQNAGGVNGSVWYTCEAGHPYSVGDCGRNVITAKCPCGAKIGGREHTTLQSNTKFDAAEHGDRGLGGGGVNARCCLRLEA